MEIERVLSPLSVKLIGETHDRKGAWKRRIRKEKMEGNILECLERKELKREGLELGLPQHYQFQKKKMGLPGGEKK